MKSARDDALLGQLVGGAYRVKARIGSGGTSDVFAVEHVRLRRTFALKALRVDGRVGCSAALRFKREVRVLAALQSEYVAAVVDCGELADGRPFFVMENLNGNDLRDLLRCEKRLSTRRTLDVLIDACWGVSAIHAAGIVHRDLKPANLFIARRSDGRDWCKVLDLGVARMHDDHNTEVGAIIGTIRYMAPEQLAEGRVACVETDVYALGTILYECLSGRPPHEAGTNEALMFKIMNESVRTLLNDGLDIPDELDRIIQRATQRRPEDRYAAVTDFRNDLISVRNRLIELEGRSDQSTLQESRTSSPRRLHSSRPSRRLRSFAMVGAFAAGCASAMVVGQEARGSVAPALDTTRCEPPVVTPLNDGTLSLPEKRGAAVEPHMPALPSIDTSKRHKPKLMRRSEMRFEPFEPTIDEVNPYETP